MSTRRFMQLDVFASAPFVKHRFQAAPGEEVSQGIRRPFVGWDDDVTATADRVIETPLQDAEYVARYAGRQVQLDLGLSGGVEGVEPGLFQTQPASADLWFEEGETVSVEAVATTGFAFLEWTGALASQPNPATVGMAAPVSGGARFELTYAVPTTPVSFPAATTLDLRLEAVDGTAPVVWVVTEGVLPNGVSIDPFGHITGAALLGGGEVVLVLDAAALVSRTRSVPSEDSPGARVLVARPSRSRSGARHWHNRPQTPGRRASAEPARRSAKNNPPARSSPLCLRVRK